MHKLFVYGTLRKGGSANNLLNGAKLLEEAKEIQGYALYDCGDFPFARVSEPNYLIGDIYNLSLSHLKKLDEYEGEMFMRHFDSKYKFFIYIYNSLYFNDFPEITSGDWLKK